MATARKTGGNEQVTTYDSAGGKDYADMGVWEGDTDTDHVTDSETDVLECYSGTHLDNVLMGGSNNDVNYFRIIKPAGTLGEDDWQGFYGVPKSDGSCVYVYRVDESLVMGTDEAYSQIQDIYCELTVPATNFQNIMEIGEPNAAIVGCAVSAAAVSTASQLRGYSCDTGGANGFIIDCLAFDISDGSGGGRAVFINDNNLCIYNYTENNCDVAIYVKAGTTTSKNCVLDDTITVDGGAVHNQTTNTTGTPTYKNAAGENYMLAYNDATAKGGGTDLSGDGSYAFDDDVCGQVRSDWSIGFSEYFWGSGTGTGYNKFNGAYAHKVAKINGVATYAIHKVNAVA